MSQETKSVLETLQSGAGWLEKRGVPEARRNMEHLLAHVLGIKRLELYLQFDRPLHESELAPLRLLLQRRGKREPLQHLIGNVDFNGNLFASDARALIPRPETEQLVVKLLAAGPPVRGAKVADIGCGSGVIGLSLALAWPDASVAMIDLHAPALDLARANAASLGLSSSTLRFFQGDLLAPLPGESLDLVVANLPYIPSAELAELDAEVQFDPAIALDGGPDGLDLIRRLASELPDILAPGGRVALEIGLGQGADVVRLLTEAGLHDARCELDFDGADRFVFAGR